jgi:CRISPR-associated protein Cas2
MSGDRLALSEYKGMWLFVLFDLPVTTDEAKRKYVQFRNTLLKDGFSMLQFSVYARFCPSEEASAVHRKRVKQALPPKGQVRILGVTDKQFAKMESFLGKTPKNTEDAPEQLLLL